MTNKAQLSGWLFGLSAFLWWGLMPIYYKLINHVDPAEILAHRIIWSIPVTLLLMALLNKRVRVISILKDRHLLLGLFISTFFICTNWYIFTWAVTHNNILATSLGYFINPIISILMGVIILGEKLEKLQWAAVVCVILGVANQAFNFGEIPWIALSLAVSFAIYGLVRKQLAVEPLNGFLIETTLALPLAAGYVFWIGLENSASFLHTGNKTDLLLLAGGIITAVPLILFAIAVKKIPLSGIGFLQFIAPSMTFILATQAYNEELNLQQLLSFIFIWVGLGLYLFEPINMYFKKKV